MTPQEKANELVNQMYIVHSNSASDITYYFAKKCALIAVDELISQMLCLMKLFNEDRSEFEAIELYYLIEVKQEIENL